MKGFGQDRLERDVRQRQVIVQREKSVYLAPLSEICRPATCLDCLLQPGGVSMINKVVEAYRDRMAAYRSRVMTTRTKKVTISWSLGESRSVIMRQNL